MYVFPTKTLYKATTKFSARREICTYVYIVYFDAQCVRPAGTNPPDFRTSRTARFIKKQQQRPRGGYTTRQVLRRMPARYYNNDFIQCIVWWTVHTQCAFWCNYKVWLERSLVGRLFNCNCKKIIETLSFMRGDVESSTFARYARACNMNMTAPYYAVLLLGLKL